jgi:hypothetical protein
MKSILPLIFILTFFNQGIAQGTWTPVVANAPHPNQGVMILLTDGTVICKSTGGINDGYGNVFDKLTPDINGSYANGTWSSIAGMHDTRLYFSSQVLMDGRLYVAGGEYGSGNMLGETYDPMTDLWTMNPAFGQSISDANSEILGDGKVLQAVVDGNLDGTSSYDPSLNTYTTGPTCTGSHNESAWVKLQDNSILFMNTSSTNSERYIPSLNQWIADATVPVPLYDPFGSETGAGLLLPDGRAFYLGATGQTAYYTPSGNNNPGTWAAGPPIPNAQGTPDAPAAMMVNGKILICVSYAPTSSGNIFDPPTFFYEFNYLTNTYTPINAPQGGLSVNIPCYTTGLLGLPDGTVMYAQQDSTRYYIYSPTGSPLAAGKPTINNINMANCDTFTITGTLFNGISEGQAYGDDWQNETNYPIIRLTSGSNVYYARTFNWNSTSVMTGNMPDTTQFTLPVGLPAGTYSLVVIANGIASDPVTFIPCFTTGVVENSTAEMISVYPNPADEMARVKFYAKESGSYSVTLTDISGRIILEENAEANVGENFHPINLEGISKGMYMLTLRKAENVMETKLVVK